MSPGLSGRSSSYYSSTLFHKIQGSSESFRVVSRISKSNRALEKFTAVKGLILIASGRFHKFQKNVEKCCEDFTFRAVPLTLGK